MKKRYIVLVILLVSVSVLLALFIQGIDKGIDNEVSKDFFIGTYDLGYQNDGNANVYLSFFENEYTIYDSAQNVLSFGTVKEEKPNEFALIVTGENSRILSLEDEKFYLADVDGSRKEIIKISSVPTIVETDQK